MSRIDLKQFLKKAAQYSTSAVYNEYNKYY